VSRNLVLMGMMVLALPVAIEAPPDSAGLDFGSPAPATFVTRMRVATGGGYYAFMARGCEGEVLDHVPVHYRDAAASIEQRIGDGGLTLGARGGMIRHELGHSNQGFLPEVPQDTTLETSYLNPHVAFEARDFGMGIGWVVHEGEFVTADEQARNRPASNMNDVSFHFRVGSERKHFAIRWMESVPLGSDGGYFTMTMGGRPDGGRLELMGGLSAGGPYEGAGPMMRVGWPLTSVLWADLGGRVTIKGDRAATGIHIGLEYRRRADDDVTRSASDAGDESPRSARTVP